MLCHLFQPAVNRRVLLPSVGNHLDVAHDNVCPPRLPLQFGPKRQLEFANAPGLDGDLGSADAPRFDLQSLFGLVASQRKPIVLL